MSSKSLLCGLLIVVLSLSVLSIPKLVIADHSWSNYHWFRSVNPLSLNLGDNVSTNWDSYLSEASSDWSASSVLDTSIIPGNTRPKNCRPTAGMVEVCNARYGNNGWLGIAQIWISGGEHISQGIVKLNDTYFNLPQYNTPAWKRLVMCQEIAHTLGLDHQDEVFDNPNLGSCMDYTSDPDGPPSNEHPNAHDFEQLEAIYAHVDSAFVANQLPGGNLPNLLFADNNSESDPGNEPSAWGRQLKDNEHVGLYVRELNGGQKVFTFVIWAE